jgi:uncharacterized protein with PIN domain
MMIDHEKIKGLLQKLDLTREREIHCEECLKYIAEYAEREIAGKPVSGILEEVEHHLRLCPECGEEYQALLEALRQLFPREDR